MKIREGAYYRTRGGQVFGPMVRNAHVDYPWWLNSFDEESCPPRHHPHQPHPQTPHPAPGYWTEGGRWSVEEERPFDLISEVYVSDTRPDAKRETEAELREMMRDPRYWQKREPKWVKRVTEGFRALVGGDTPPADALPSDGSVNFENCSVGTYTPAPETKTLRDDIVARLVARLMAVPVYDDIKEAADLIDSQQDRIEAQAAEIAHLEQARRAMLRGSLRKSRQVLTHGMPKREKDLLAALITPGLCETVSFADRLEASFRARRFVNPPIGWGINYEEPWELTDVGIMAIMEPGEIDKIHAELRRKVSERGTKGAACAG